MARKEINIFGTSFLDLLSGALGAVIILFIIVPKMSSQQQEALQELEELNVQVEQLTDLMEQIENSVPQELYQQIEQQLEELQQTVATLSDQVEQLQSSNEQLRNELARLRTIERDLAQIQAENQQLQERVEALQEQQAQQDGQGISDGKVFGINADVGVVCFWRENADIDLHVKDLSSGSECYYQRKECSFGVLNEDIQSRTEADDDRYELFYQQRPVPGRYEISVVYFDGPAPRAMVEGYIVMHPGQRDQIKIPYEDVTLRPNDQRPILIGILTVTENSIDFQQY